MSTAGRTSRASRRGAATTDSAPERIIATRWFGVNDFRSNIACTGDGPEVFPETSYIRQDISDAAVEAEHERAVAIIDARIKAHLIQQEDAGKMRAFRHHTSCIDELTHVRHAIRETGDEQ